jgi:hypothetical protein
MWPTLSGRGGAAWRWRTGIEWRPPGDDITEVAGGQYAALDEEERFGSLGVPRSGNSSSSARKATSITRRGGRASLDRVVRTPRGAPAARGGEARRREKAVKDGDRGGAREDGQQGNTLTGFREISQMCSRCTITIAVAAMVFGTAVAPEHVEAQTTIQTQQGPPPAPNAKAPEYAPPASGAPTGPPAIEPSPGKPSLAPVPGTVDDRGQIRTGAGAWTIFGLRPMTAILVALGLAGLLVLVLGSMARKPARGFPVGHDIDSSSDGGRRNGEA